MMDIVELLIKTIGSVVKSNNAVTVEESNVSVANEQLVYSSSDIMEYSDALRKEIHFLKLGKGKKYKIVNGEKLDKNDKGVYTYSFEMETDLHLPDDAPIVVETFDGIRAIGTVLVCEDFEMILL